MSKECATAARWPIVAMLPLSKYLKGSEGDGVAEGLQLADVVAFLGVRVEVFGEVVASEISEPGVVGSEEVPDDDQDRAPDRDKGAFLASPFGDAPIPGTEEGVGSGGRDGGLERMAAR